MRAVIVLALLFSLSAWACKRNAMTASTAELGALNRFLLGQKALALFDVDKLEIEGNRYVVTLSSGDKKCTLGFVITTNPECKSKVEPVQKVECP